MDAFDNSASDKIRTRSTTVSSVRYRYGFRQRTSAGASILEKGTTNGVQTDFDGNFSIGIADENATLVFSYIGFPVRKWR